MTTKTYRGGKYDAHIIAILEDAGAPLTSGVIAARVADRMAQTITPPPYVDVPTIGDVCKRMHDAGLLERHIPRNATKTTGYRWTVKAAKAAGGAGT